MIRQVVILGGLLLCVGAMIPTTRVAAGAPAGELDLEDFARWVESQNLGEWEGSVCGTVLLETYRATRQLRSDPAGDRIALYREDFTNNPIWTIENPGAAGWDEDAGTMAGTFGGSATAFKKADRFDPNRGWILDFDIKVNSVQGWPGPMVGLFIPGMLMEGGVQVVKWGDCALLVVGGLVNGGAGVSTCESFWATGAWYRMRIEYDPAQGLLHLTASDARSGERLVHILQAVGGFDPAMQLIGIGPRWQNWSADLELDNVTLWQAVEGGACCGGGICRDIPASEIVARSEAGLSVPLQPGDACQTYICDHRTLFAGPQYPDYQGCSNDVDGNGIVNAADRGIISANLGATDPALICLTDVNGDGMVNAADRGQVSAHIGGCEQLPAFMNGSAYDNAAADGRFAGAFEGMGTGCETGACP